MSRELFTRKEDSNKLFMNLFTLNIFYQILSNSLLKEIYSRALFSYVGYGLIVILFFVGILNGLIHLNRYREIIKFFLLLTLIIVLFVQKNTSILFLVVFGFIASYLSISEVMECFFSGTICAVLLLLILCALSIVPYRDAYTGNIQLGFSNPNTIGFYFGLIPMEMFFLRKNKFSILLMSIISFVANFFLFQDYTMVLVLFIFIFILYLGKVFPRLLFSKTVKLITILLPYILTSLSIYLAINFTVNPLMYRINNMLSNRLYFWQEYIMAFPPKLGYQVTNMNQVYPLSFNAKWPFDGSYIYYLVTSGYVTYTIFLIVTTVAIYYFFKKKNVALIALTVASLAIGFSESLLFSFYQSPFGVLAVAIVLFKIPFEKRENL